MVLVLVCFLVVVVVQVFEFVFVEHRQFVSEFVVHLQFVFEFVVLHLGFVVDQSVPQHFPVQPLLLDDHV